MWAALDRVTLLCFGASYAFALAFELLHLLRPRPVLRLASLGLGIAGLLAHTIYLGVHSPSPAAPPWALILLSWVLAIFYLYGSIHHRRVAWGIFVLPLILGLVGLAAFFPRAVPEPASGWQPEWGTVHGILLLLAAVGVCVGFIASVMYLVQAHRLKAKTLPGQGLRLLSLERLEAMNRHALTWAFPLLTAGLLIGLILLTRVVKQGVNWLDPRVISFALLWLVFAILLYLRYGLHVRGKRVAVLTIVAFALLLVTLTTSHPLGQGVGR